ncbi:hypothetical protein Ancab_004713, partial [Ancistrocladus abbreviatus]
MDPGPAYLHSSPDITKPSRRAAICRPKTLTRVKSTVYEIKDSERRGTDVNIKIDEGKRIRRQITISTTSFGNE